MTFTSTEQLIGVFIEGFLKKAQKLEEQAANYRACAKLLGEEYPEVNAVSPTKYGIFYRPNNRRSEDMRFNMTFPTRKAAEDVIEKFYGRVYGRDPELSDYEVRPLK